MNTQNTKDDFILGLILTLGINLGIFMLGFLLYVPLMMSSMKTLEIVLSICWYIGLSQWAYIIPWTLKLRIASKTERIKGMITGGIITLLINGACFGQQIMQIIFPG